MMRLLQYARPFAGIVTLAVVLLFLQAMAELALPAYTADIVDVGIQQGGVETAVPVAIRETELDKLLLFMTDAEAEQVLGAYALFEPGSAEADAYTQDYPLLAEEALYVLGDERQSTIDALNPIMAEAWLVVAGIQQGLDDPEALTTTGGVFSAIALPEDVSDFEALAALPLAERLQIRATLVETLATIGGGSVTQAAAVAVRAEYEAIGINLSSVQSQYILGVGVIMVGLSVFAGVCIIAVNFLSSRTAAGTARNMRKALFEHISRFSNTEFDKFSVASLITRTTNDVTQIQTFVNTFIQLVVFAPLIGIGGIIVAIQTAPSMWWTIALAVVIVMTVVISLITVVVPKFQILQQLTDRLNLVARENLTGILVVRAFNTQRFEEQRFDAVNRELTDTNLFVSRTLALLFPAIMLVMNGATLLIIWVGSQQVAQLSIQVGDMIAFLQYAVQVVGAFLALSFVFILLPRAAVSAQRIAEVLAAEPSVQDPVKPKALPQGTQRRIEFDNVSFRYPGAEADVLCQISFSAEPGTTTAIIGSTGAGKTTLVNLIPRFYDVTDGSIRIDGVDVREITQNDLRAEIGYVPQQALLFKGTIASNLRYADADAPADVLQEATEIAQAQEFISRDADGLAAEISQGGSNVSGGQRQRLTIARALVKQAPIYIFDDSFSALDYRTDAALRKALNEKAGDSTMLVVTQRVSTVQHADQIIVLDKGRIVGTGTHEQLLASNHVYQEIAESQLRAEDGVN